MIGVSVAVAFRMDVKPRGSPPSANHKILHLGTAVLTTVSILGMAMF